MPRREGVGMVAPRRLGRVRASGFIPALTGIRNAATISHALAARSLATTNVIGGDGPRSRPAPYRSRLGCDTAGGWRASRVQIPGWRILGWRLLTGDGWV